MATFVDIAEAKRAEEYVRDELADGTTLAKLVLESIDLARGRFRVAMPHWVVQTGPRFNLKYELFRLDGNEETAFGRVVKAFVAEPDSAVILQDTMRSMSDPCMTGAPNRALAVSYGQEVYWMIAGAVIARLSDDEIWDLINEASFWPFSAFFFRGGVPPGEDGLQDSDLHRIVEQLVGLAVGAFDDRSYLVWWRDDQCPFPENGDIPNTGLRGSMPYDIAALKRKAEEGSLVAQTILGFHFLKGIDVQVDYAEARRLLSMAAGQGASRAQLALGQMYAQGLGVPVDFVQAKNLFSLAAKRGEMLAQVELGRMYSRGIGVAADEKLALNWYAAAAEQEDRVLDCEEMHEAKAYVAKVR